MAISFRPNKKATKILYGILGKPAMTAKGRDGQSLYDDPNIRSNRAAVVQPIMTPRLNG